MFKITKALLLILFALALACSPLQAALVSCIGSPDSSGNCPIEIDDSSQITFPGTVIQKYEVSTTNDTLTASDSGKVYLVNYNTGPIGYALPTSTAGLTYTFTAINGHATSGQARIYINPAITDTFVGCVNSSVTSTFAAGDSLYSPGATGDSVTIVGYPLYWYCTDRIGTWVDGGATAYPGE